MNHNATYLLDTDTCIYLLNGIPQVKAHVAAVGVKTLAVGMVTQAELYFGAYNSQRVDENLDRLEAFFTSPGPCVLPLDTAAVKYFGQFKTRLRRAGQIIGDVDLFIAGLAASQGLVVVTNNTDHFERISEITVTNWHTPLPESPESDTGGTCP
jgi:tRNA(fMet)-specific endonuclease VapC